MKLDQTTYNKIKVAVKAVVEHAGGPQAVKAEYQQQNLTERRMLWDVFRFASRNLQYDDTHPAFSQGMWTRVCPYDPHFNVYADRSVKDDHIFTALKRIGKELGLI